MRLIDADALEELFRETIGHIAKRPEIDGALEHMVRASAMAVEMIRDAQTVDAVPVVRCKDCKQWDEEGSYMGRGWCGYQMKSTGPRYFCADGEKGEEEDYHG